jgi:hypothetical protein
MIIWVESLDSRLALVRSIDLKVTEALKRFKVGGASFATSRDAVDEQ